MQGGEDKGGATAWGIFNLESRQPALGWMKDRRRLYLATALLTIGIGIYFLIRGLMW